MFVFLCAVHGKGVTQLYGETRKVGESLAQKYAAVYADRLTQNGLLVPGDGFIGSLNMPPFKRKLPLH